ncbi:hypothetical protein [Nocardia sp. NPDC051463]|uniref:hypothetical protein n=1 Tax=Nocardia sp. NPDC051463 TaxID=3154845 RepID=UPI003421E152
MQLRHLGPPVRHPRTAPIAEPYLRYLFGLLITEEVTAVIIDKQQSLVDALGARVAGRKPLCLLNPSERAATAFCAQASHGCATSRACAARIVLSGATSRRPADPTSPS